MNDEALPARGSAAARWGVPILGFGVFAVATNEFVLAGMLPRLRDTLGVSIPTAGQVVTVFALSCAIFGPILATVTAAWPRRLVLLVAAAIYCLGTAAAALAPSFALLLVAQAVAAAGTGLFVPVACATGAALVAPERRGRAIATVLVGFTTATAFGAPIGTAIGGPLGWRATMWFVVAVALVGMLGLIALVPRSVSTPPPAAVRERLAPLADARVVTTLLTTMLAFTSVYILYTYVAEVFEPAVGGDDGRLPLLLFVFGTVAIFGSYATGLLTDRVGGRLVTLGCLVWVAIGLALLPLVRDSFGVALAFMAVFALAAFSMSAPQQHRLIELDYAAAPLLVSLHASILYLSIALAGVIGALAVSAFGTDALGFVAAAVALLALAASETADRLTRRQAGLPVGGAFDAVR